ncbi:MAG: hypothetical protein ACD_41C00348G0006 [uncultured bacterium]|nr:MAG: hypothetical protein ACD_41C00348G0006 [uncultured bacterium]HBY74307.1 DUF1294 domain-containing protein [Candidatus Kerfeldbacteria bacterium]
MDLASVIILYGISINLITLVMFWFDKWMARSRGWRIPELVLWLLALLGGSIGAVVATGLFHHKNRKLSFQLVLWLIILVQVGMILGLTGLWKRFEG